MTIDIKLKTYEQLQFEITKLNTDIFLKDKEIERLKNELAKIPKAKMEYDLEIERLNNIINDMDKQIDNLCNNQKREVDRLSNIINELEKYIGQEWYCFDNESIEFKVSKDILDKLKELRESGNNE